MLIKAVTLDNKICHTEQAHGASKKRQEMLYAERKDISKIVCANSVEQPTEAAVFPQKIRFTLESGRKITRRKLRLVTLLTPSFQFRKVRSVNGAMRFLQRVGITQTIQNLSKLLFYAGNAINDRITKVEGGEKYER